MKTKLMNTKAAAFILAFMMVDSGPALAATVSLSGATNSCSYDSYTALANGNLSVICSGGTTPPLAPTEVPACTSLIVSPVSTSYVLTANCTGADSYKWTGGTAAGSTSTTVTVSPTAQTVYLVQGLNSKGLSLPVEATVTPQTSAPPPSSDIPANCTVVDITWAPGFKFGITPVHHLPSGKMFAFKMTVPANSPYHESKIGYATEQKYMSISANACDFSAAVDYKCKAYSKVNNPLIWNTGGNESGACHLPPAGSVVYYNVRNASSATGPDSCPVGSSCPLSLGW